MPLILSPLTPAPFLHLSKPTFSTRFHSLRFHSPCTQSRTFSIPPAATPQVNGDPDVFTKYSGYLFEGVREVDFIDGYDPKKIADVYRRKPFLLIRRAFQIATTLGRWFVSWYIDRVLGRSDQMFKTRAQDLRMIFLELGPAFVKIAQAVSSRSDVIPPAYLEELSLLQDRIAPFSTEIAFDTIEKELELPLDVLFSEISPEPVAAASLGQVYQARLYTSGKLVAVKVQRPGVQAAISLDIFILRFLAGLLKRAAKLNTDLQAVVDEWASSLFREMDYRAEAMNGLKFRKLYGGLQNIFVPGMYLEMTTRRVLIMEWIEGSKLSDAKDLYLVEVGVYCSLSQLLDYGFYHADPHPGNLMRTSDGKLAYLDFGMMGEFRQELRYGFIEACLHLVNRDFDALSKDFVTLGLLPPNAESSEVAKALTDVFQNAVDRGVRNISFGDLSGNLGRTMYQFKFQIPSYFSLVIRSLAVLEGIAIGLNPNYKVLSSSYPWIARKVLTDSSSQLQLTLKNLLYKEGIFRIDRLESLLQESLRARIDMRLPKDKSESSNSKVAMKQLLAFILTEKGSFVREILLQEFSKGIDALGLVTLENVTFGVTPTLSDEDITNLKTLRRLISLLSNIHNIEKLETINENIEVDERKTYTKEASLVLSQVTSLEGALPVLSVIPELSPELQQKLLLLPADLLSKLFFRASARTLRRLFL